MMISSESPASPAMNSFRNRAHLTVDVSAANGGDDNDVVPADGGRYDPKTPPGMRGHNDLRSPGVKKTPLNADAALAKPGFNNEDDTTDVTESTAASNAAAPDAMAIPDFITQTDAHGNATTPRTAEGISAARRMHPSGPKPKLHVDAATGALVEGSEESAIEGESAANVNSNGAVSGSGPEVDDACETLLDSFRMMCCCLLPEDGNAPPTNNGAGAVTNGEKNVSPSQSPTSPANHLTSPSNHHHHSNTTTPSHPIGYSTRGHDAPLLLEEHSALRNGNDPNKIKLLPELHVDDAGKKCLVLDLDETLVHSSFRAVPGADFVIPVQIEDVVHFVYVAKRPGVDEFLLEMAKHYEIVVYTASLNKYADVLLDLLDPHRVIRTRLFRESCVFYEGNYVKDLSLLNRELSQCVIIDNSPASYLFHPENAIDCTSFIDDVSDRELDHIGKFLVGVKDVRDVRGTVNLWRHWPNVDLTKNHRRIR